MAVDTESKSLVSTEWLEAHLGQPDLRIVDATYYLPMQNKSARAEYDQRHIPGAVFFDVDEISDTSTDLPHMLPPADKFGSRMKKLGIGDGSRIVVYDGNGGIAAPRVWWTLRTFGHRDVAVLDGGLMKWMAEDRPLEDMPPVPRERHFTPRLDNTMVRSKQQLLDNLQSKREQVLDARAAGRFNATEPEIWPGRRAGHIPGSLNLPYTQLLRPDGEPVQLNYVFRQGDAGWKIIDIYLSGTISEMARMRSDFAETIRTGGADGLIAVLEKKINELKAGA